MPSNATEMPDTVKTTLLSAAIVLGVIAAGGNLGHVFDAVRHAGQGEAMSVVIALMPDVLLVLCIFKIRYDHRSVWAWIGLAASVGFIIWASIVTSKAGLEVNTAGTATRRAVALSPLAVAVIAAGLIESRPAPAPSRRAKPDTGAPKPPAASSAPAAAGPTAGPESPPAPGRPLHLADSSDQPADELLPVAQTVVDGLVRSSLRVNRDNLVAGIRAQGRTCSNERGSQLLKQIREGAA